MKRVIGISAGISAMALLALGACGKKTETASATSAAAPAAATAPMAPPSRKPGLWTQTISTSGMTQTIKMCLDAAADQKMKWWGSSQMGKSGGDCSEQRVTPHPGGGWDFHSVCKMGESGTVTSDGSATGDFGSHYKVEVNAVTTGSAMAQANGTHKMTMEGTWTGPCPADMKPGDMEMPGGIRINTLTPGSSTTVSIVQKHSMNAGDIAQLRAQAQAMAKAAREQAGK